MGAILMWTPTADEIKKTHIQQALESHHLDSYEQLHADSVQNWESFWQSMIAQFKIRFFKSPAATADISQGIERIYWLPGAELNIAASALESREPEFKAIEFQRPNGSRESWSYAELNQKSRQVAEGLKRLGLQKGDAIAIDMMMTAESVAIYLGIILMGGVVVSIADSFPAEEIAKRLRISNAKLIFTQDFLLRGEKTFPLFERIVAANSPPAIVLSLREKGTVSLRSGDLFWSEFLPQEELKEAAKCLAEDPINILFSSGTTGDPKAIPWNHTTPIKAASDAFWHHNLQEGDIVCWPTNLGWMMGPWLIFASLLNRCTIAVFEGSPLEREFCEFVSDSRVTMLGVVPSLVKNWRKNKLLEAVDWSYIKCFSSTGEASSPEDYTWLMSAGQKPNVTKPILEYCGGTEIGGAYISSALTKPNEPSIFNAKVMGVDFVVLNDLGHPCSQGEVGEVFLKTPSMGLSTRLLNRDHHKIYFEACPEGLQAW
jgi:acetyl-CoA synthetase